jgi:hypothetical protein
MHAMQQACFCIHSQVLPWYTHASQLHGLAAVHCGILSAPLYKATPNELLCKGASRGTLSRQSGAAVQSECAHGQCPRNPNTHNTARGQYTTAESVCGISCCDQPRHRTACCCISSSLHCVDPSASAACSSTTHPTQQGGDPAMSNSAAWLDSQLGQTLLLDRCNFASY